MTQAFLTNTCRNIKLIIRIINILDERRMWVYDIQCFKWALDSSITDCVHIFEGGEVSRFHNSHLVDRVDRVDSGGGCSTRSTAFFTFGFRICRGSSRLFPTHHRRLFINIHRLHIVNNKPVRSFLYISDLSHVYVNMLDGLIDMTPV